ncbi:MAG: rod shape-determining protein MreD [Prevotella sp.]
MTIDLFKQLGTFVVLCAAQALVFNRIHLFGCATPLIYIYMILKLRRNYPQWGALLWSFALGLTIDAFSNTPGVAAASLTLIGAVQPYFMKLFVQRDAAEDLKPSINTLGFSKFCFFTFCLTLLYCTVFFVLETFNFFNWVQWLLQVGGSTLVTFVMIITFDSVSKK